MFIITGGAGFIGSNLAYALQETYPQVPIVIVDWLGQEHKWRNLQSLLPYTIINPDTLDKYIGAHQQNIKAIFHLGAISTTTVVDGDAVIKQNFHYSQDLWQHCSQYQIPFIYASSAATYGDGDKGFDDNQTQLHTLRPLNLYGWSKHVFDRWVDQQIKMQQPCPPQWVGCKFFNVYGPQEYHKGSQRSVVAALYDMIIKPNIHSLPLFKSYRAEIADGEQQRDFIYVKDCVAVMLWCYTQPSISGIFNVGTGQARTFNDLAIALMQASGKILPIEYIEMPETLRTQYQYFTKASMTKLQNIGYSLPFTSLEKGVHDYVTRYLQQADPYLQGSY